MGNGDYVPATATDGVAMDAAFRLCEAIQEENRGKWYRWTAWMCWGCRTFSKGDKTKMCVAHRGCMQVNARLARQQE